MRARDRFINRFTHLEAYALVIITALGGVACDRNPSPLNPAEMTRIFTAQFVYVGEFDYGSLTKTRPDAVQQVGEHAYQPVSGPDRIEAGKGYVWHKRGLAENEKLGLEEFPTRLRSIGAKITKAPPSSDKWIRFVVGGPFFTIEFEYKGHKGYLFNSLDQGLVDGRAGAGWAVEDFVLVFPARKVS